MVRDWSLPRVVLATLIGAVVVALVVAGSTSAVSFGVFNTNWDGTSQVSAVAEETNTRTTVARSVSDYPAAPSNDTLAVVLSPDEPYGNEANTIRSYVRDGGTLLVAEDYGSGGNELLEAVGATARIDGRPLRDETRADPGPAFPEATVNSSHPTTTGVETLVLNHGSVVEPGNATVLANSSPFSYLDGNRNEALDESEVITSHPVVTTEQVGQGTVIVVSDPSIFLNAMLDRGDNRAFLKVLVEDRAHVVLDVSHTTALPPLVAARLALQDSALGIVILGALSILAVLLATDSRRSLPWRSSPDSDPTSGVAMSHEEIVRAVRERHEEWTDERIARVTDSLIQADDNDRTDD